MQGLARNNVRLGLRSTGVKLVDRHMQPRGGIGLGDGSNSWHLESMSPDASPLADVPDLVRRLYEIVAELEQRFLGRRFTPDGHLVGSIGEVIAAHRYGLSLLAGSAERHDARTFDGRLVQIKATQSKSVGLRSAPAFLLVLALRPNGEAVEVFNGPGSLAWDGAGPLQRNGQRSIGLSRLRELMEHIPSALRLPRVAT